MSNILLPLVQNTLLVLGFVFFFSIYFERLQTLPKLASQVIIGISFGIFGLINLLLAVEIAPGVVVDVRSPFIIIAGFMGGLPGTITAAILLGFWRYFVTSGTGALPGTLAILGNIPLGYLAYRWRGHRWRVRLLLLGLASVLVSVGIAYVILAPNLFSLFIRQFLPSSLILYPLTTYVLGELVFREERTQQLNEALRQSEARFRAIFNQTFQFIGLLKPDGTLIEANDTTLKFAGLAPAEVIGNPFWEAHWWSNSEANRQQLRDAIQRAAQGEFVRYRVDVVGAEGKTVTIDFSLNPIKDQSGQVNLLIPEGRDITSEILAEERRVELALERERAELTRQFIEDASHHLRTPITILGTSTYLSNKILAQLEQTLAEDPGQATLDRAKTFIPKLHKRMAVCKKGISDLSNVVEELLQLTRLDTMNERETEAVNFRALLLEELKPYNLMAQQNQLVLTVHAPVTPHIIQADPQHLRLIVQNLVENALHYTPPGGTVTVHLNASATRHQLRVTDTGIGISPEDLPRIFSRFYRADNATDERPNGSGLGLAIVQRVVEQEGGTVEVDSTPGQGTTFTVTLPSNASADPATASSRTPSPSTSSPTPPHPASD